MKGVNLLLSALLLISGTCAIRAGSGNTLKTAYASAKEKGAQVWRDIPSLQDIKTACEINKIKGQLGTIPANAQEYIKSHPAKVGLIALAVPVATWILWKLLPGRKAVSRKKQQQAGCN